ncbi:MAG: ASKHA domain-containing protein [Acetivibrio sp.]
MKLCIDVGTTTIAIAAFDDFSGLRIEETFLNQQRFFGVDVISRIKASMDGSGEMLRSLLQNNLSQGVDRILEKAGVRENSITSVTLAANTTMVHLLLGYSCQNLSAYPFEPVFLDTLTLPSHEIFGKDKLTCPITILPGISAFIGGDILSGLYQINMDQREELTFFLDLGTNGEMALGNKNRILTASAAAGPAFEGGNIKYGMAAIKGAIYHIDLIDEKISFKTIEYGRPVGICGSGIIDLASELLKNKIMDSTGLLREPYFSEGFYVTKAPQGKEGIGFFQSDIREVQMAKSAIRVGIQLLCKEYGCRESDIKKVYLSGAFGSSSNLEKAFDIGLFPLSWKNVLTPLGNTSLLGAIKYATQKDSEFRTFVIKKKSQVLYLANSPDFEKEYISHLNF